MSSTEVVYLAQGNPIKLDTTPPVITVLGNNPETIEPGATYTDAGATALDDFDGAVAVVTTGADAVSTTADANFSDVKLLLSLDSDFTDASTSAHTVTVSGGAAITTSEKKFGGRIC